ncbi:MAG: PQQ-dependent sugar dehydrogenase [Nitrospirota bacterium]|nr:PQQ-dependent sugar dehydrogenase [Nitrospirota bacterium]
MPLLPLVLSLLTLFAVPALAADVEVRVADKAPMALALEPVASGLSRPVFLTHSGAGDGRLFVVEQGGRIRVLDGRGGKAAVFADLRPMISGTGEERGLLGLAFHPQFKKNGQLFVYLTDRRGDILLARLNVTPKQPDRVDPASFKVLLRIDNPAPNHNGGMIAFGPDGYLYIGVGDGGGAGDPFENAQNSYSLMGKILRIDVNGDSEHPYRIPPDNPFLRRNTHRPEIWALGLRNPWRFSFDRASGDLFIADVGQDHWEEVNFLPKGSEAGKDFGWNKMEGRHCFPPDSEFRDTKSGRRQIKKCDYGEMPIVEYSHELGCSVTGGYVYRGSRVSGMDGVYLMGDYCSGAIWGVTPRRDDPARFIMRPYLETDLRISSFGEGPDGEVYVLDRKGGGVYQIVARGNR